MWQYDSPGKKESFSIENMTAEACSGVAEVSIYGTRERIGKMDGVWRDTVLLERRSDRLD